MSFSIGLPQTSSQIQKKDLVLSQPERVVLTQTYLLLSHSCTLLSGASLAQEGVSPIPHVHIYTYLQDCFPTTACIQFSPDKSYSDIFTHTRTERDLSECQMHHLLLSCSQSDQGSACPGMCHTTPLPHDLPSLSPFPAPSTVPTPATSGGPEGATRAHESFTS